MVGLRIAWVGKEKIKFSKKYDTKRTKDSVLLSKRNWAETNEISRSKLGHYKSHSIQLGSKVEYALFTSPHTLSDLRFPRD